MKKFVFETILEGKVGFQQIITEVGGVGGEESRQGK